MTVARVWVMVSVLFFVASLVLLLTNIDPQGCTEWAVAVICVSVLIGGIACDIVLLRRLR